MSRLVHIYTFVSSQCASFLSEQSNGQVYRSTVAVDAAWFKKKKAMSWTNATTSQAERDAKKFDVVQSFYPGRWPEYRSYELTSLVYNEARSSYMLSRGRRSARVRREKVRSRKIAQWGGDGRVDGVPDEVGANATITIRVPAVRVLA